MSITTPALAALATAGLVAAGLAAGSIDGPASAHDTSYHQRGHLTLMVRSAARDLQPTTDPTDGIAGRVKVWRSDRTTTVSLRLSGFAPAAAGTTLGAHLHVGPCVAGDGAAAGPHYNSDVIAGSPTPVVSDRTEVWLDVVVGPHGTAHARATVPFVVEPGAHSIVIHAMPTAPNGTAGARLACLPVVW